MQFRVSSGTIFGTDSEHSEQLAATNAALKARGVKGRIVVVRDSLFLRGTFTTGDGTPKDRKIFFDLPAHNGHLLEDENRVISLADIFASTGIVSTVLPWQTVAPTIRTAETTTVLTVAEGYKQLETQHWEGKVPTSAALRSWKRIETELNRIGVPNAELTPAFLGCRRKLHRSRFTLQADVMPGT